MGIAAVVSVTSTLLGVREQRRAGKAQRKASKKAERQSDIRAVRERRETIRQARVRRADILSESANTGAAGSSSEVGAIGALQSQLGENLGASFQLQTLSKQQTGFNRQASKFQTNASIFNTVASISTGFIEPQTPPSQ